MKVKKNKFIFKTKAETLDSLIKLIGQKYFCEQIFFNYNKWLKERDEIVVKIIKQFKKKIVVRSSCHDEDTNKTSNAGVFLSVLGVLPNKKNIIDSIEKVFKSYKKIKDKDQVLIQPLVRNVSISGVLTTKEISMGSPYFVITYDDVSGKTDTVTGGLKSKSIMLLNGNEKNLKSQRLIKLVKIVKTIIKKTNCDALDIEFCIDNDEKIMIFQVRRLTKNKTVNFNLIKPLIKKIEKQIKSNTIFSTMADWNPSEIIGSNPRPLALNLYQYLVTDKNWYLARKEMGYEIVPFPLITNFQGKPYINVNYSLKSLMPASMPKKIKSKLLKFQLQTLSKDRLSHDKIEFDIAYTCLNFSFNDYESKLKKDFNKKEISIFKQCLFNQTSRLINEYENEFKKLNYQNKELSNINLNENTGSKIDHAIQLLNHCREFGTKQFAIFARHAFIGTSILRSLVRIGMINEKEYDCFMSNIKTVTSEFLFHLDEVNRNKRKMDDFLLLYGHLRPGTYDITSSRYDEDPEFYLSKDFKYKKQIKKIDFLDKKKIKIERIMNEFGFLFSPDKLFSYIGESVRMREKSKFIFTKCISDALKLITDWGYDNQFSRDDLSFLGLSNLKKGNKKKEISSKRKEFTNSNKLFLPQVIESKSDIHLVRLPFGQPTFITKKKITSKSIHIENNDIKVDFTSKIILIQNADPGYDWIFSQNIGGLITAYGGSNSHMAIRCVELSIPAAIGCGERMFVKLKNSRVIYLNCNEKLLKVIE